MTREALLTQTFVEMADSLVDDFDVVDLLALLAERCIDVLDVASAGIFLADRAGVLHVLAASDPAADRLEHVELRTGSGPCLDAYVTGQVVADGDLTLPGAWPLYWAEAVGLGFLAVHAVPLRLRGKALGALNLFHTTTTVMPAEDLVVARAFADIATIAILQHQATVDAHALNDQLQEALQSRVTIEQAKGIVGTRSDLTMDEAFVVLRDHARRERRKLSEVARAVVEGDLRP